MEDPQFSSEEEEGSISQDNDDDSRLPSGIDSEEDVIIVHKDVKKSHCLTTTTTTTTSTSTSTDIFGRPVVDADSYQKDNLLTVNDSREEEEEQEEGDIMLEEDDSRQDLEKIEKLEEETEDSEEFTPHQSPLVTEDSGSAATDRNFSMKIQHSKDSEEEANNGEHTNEDNNHEKTLSLESTSDTEVDSLKEERDFPGETLEKTVPENADTECDTDDDARAIVQKTTDIEEEEEEAAESEPEIIQRTYTASEAVSKEESQILIKCSQGFGFFVDR